jgi:outer membrane protein assembly factor BamB
MCALLLVALTAGVQEGPMRQAELIGIPIKAVVYGNSHAAFARSPQGREGMFYIPYYSTTGGALIGYHAASGELTKVKLASAGGYGCVQGADGALYIGGISPGNLYRYEPATNEVTNLGGAQFGAQYIWDTAASPEGKVYGACYPTCSVIEYDIQAGELRDLGRMVEGEQYVRSLCVDHRGKVWAGVGTHAHLVVLDPRTGEKRDVLPEERRGNSCCYDLQASGKYVLVSILYDGETLVFDADAEQLVRVIPRPEGSLAWMNARGGDPGKPYLYSTPGGDLYEYDIEADKLTLLAPNLGQCAQVQGGRYVHGIDDQDYFLYDLQEREYVDRRTLAAADDGMQVYTLTGAPDGHLYGSTYINQHIFAYKPDSGRLTDLGKCIRIGGQVDSIHAGRDGLIYLGSYVHATLSIYDPRRPWSPSREPGGNPRELGMVGHGQYRTQAILLGPDDNIWVGTIPSYNSAPTGALSRWDPATGEHKSWLDLVPGGSVTRLAADDTYLYCGGGGRFFVWDPRREAKVHEEPRAVHSLAVTEGEVLGNSGDEMFVFDPRTMAVAATFPAPLGAMEHLAVAPSGLVYGINGKGIAEVDVPARTATQVSAEGGQLIAVDTRGDVYFARGAGLWRLK